MASPQLDEAAYARWFAWAKDNLGGDLEATHAAAEAGCDMEQSGRLREACESAARSAGAAPRFVESRTVALAEWAYWAHSDRRLNEADSLRAAREALAELDATHDLEVAKARVDVLPATPAAQPQAATAVAPGSGFWRRNWGAVVGLMIASAVVAAFATAGILSAFTSPSTVTVTGPAPSMTVAVEADGRAVVSLFDFPPGQTYYVLLDDTSVATVTTNDSGFATAVIDFPLGGHTARACIEPTGDTCFASAFGTRSAT